MQAVYALHRLDNQIHMYTGEENAVKTRMVFYSDILIRLLGQRFAETNSCTRNALCYACMYICTSCYHLNVSRVKIDPYRHF